MIQQKRNISTPLERWLLLLFIATMPLQENIPTVYGISFPVILLGMLTSLLLFQGDVRNFSRVLKMPLVLSFFLYIAVTSYVEFMHVNAFYVGIIRTLLNYCGAIVLGVAIKDVNAFKFVVVGYLISGIYLGIVLYIYGWGTLSSGASTFFEADSVRDEILLNLPIREGANTIASRSAVCVLLVLLLVLVRTSIFKINKKVLIGVMIVQSLSLFVTMSRTGLAILIGSTLILAYRHRLFSYQRLGYLFFMALILYLLAPQSYVERMQIGVDKNEYELADSRSVTLNMSLKEIRKNYLWGTGEGNLWIGDYSRVSALSFYNESEDYYFVGGTHNLFFQTVLQWGLLGLFAFLYMQYNVIKLLPKRKENDFASLAIAAFNIAIFILIFFVHEGGNKEFAIAYGLLIAYHLNLKKEKSKLLNE